MPHIGNGAADNPGCAAPPTSDTLHFCINAAIIPGLFGRNACHSTAGPFVIDTGDQTATAINPIAATVPIPTTLLISTAVPIHTVNPIHVIKQQPIQFIP
ncbi:hypothetical protein RUND412_010679 [Rhizina undulata]